MKINQNEISSRIIDPSIDLIVSSYKIGGTLQFGNYKTEASIQLDDKKGRYKITFSLPFDMRLDIGNVNSTAKFICTQFEIYIKDLFITNIHSTTLDVPNREFTGVFEHFESKTNDDVNSYYRSIIPIDKSIRFDLFLKVNNLYSIGQTYYRSGWKGTIFNQSICVFDHIIAGHTFLFIESSEQNTLIFFENITFAIRNAIGYLNGVISGTSLWVFSYRTKKLDTPISFKVKGIRTFNSNQFSPIVRNAHSLPIPYKVAEKYYKLNIPVLSCNAFSTFVQKIEGQIDFTNLIHTLVDGHGFAIHPKAFSYMVSLELLANLCNQEFGKVNVENPIRKSEWRIILQKFRSILEESCSLSMNEKQHINKRLDYINQKTNRNRLVAPFKTLGINLHEKDLQIFEHRNDLLHGRMPTYEEGETITQSNEYLFYIALRTLVLLNKIILKWIGYTGFTPNYCKIYCAEKYLPAEEDYYCKV